MYQIKTPFDVHRGEIHNIVHPHALPLYCRKFRIFPSFELTSSMYVLLVDNLPINDSVLNRDFEVNLDVPFSLRAILRQKLRPADYQGRSARYQFKEPEAIKSVYEEIPPLSASVVEFERSSKGSSKSEPQSSPVIISEDKEVVCTRTLFSLSCGHTERNYEFDALDQRLDNPSNRFAVVGEDKIIVKQEGTCAHDNPLCPVIKLTGPNVDTIEKETPFNFTVYPPSIGQGNIASLKDFLGSLSRGYDSYQRYQLHAQGCETEQPSAEVHVYDPYQWGGRLTLEYEEQWKVTSSLKGRMGASEWSLEAASPDNSFSNFLNKLNSIIQQVKSFVGQAESGHGYKAFKSGFTPPKLSVGGGVDLVERELSPDIGLKGNLDLRFEPLIGFNFSCDVITTVIQKVFPSKLADPILEARKAAKGGIESSTGKVKTAANVGIELSINGRIDALLGWEFQPDGRCLPTQDSDASQISQSIGISLKAVTDAKVEVFIISVQIGSQMSLEGSDGEQGVGLLFSSYATEIDNKPALAGKAVFSGVKLVYSYHSKVLVKGKGDKDKLSGGMRDEEESLIKKEVKGKKVLLEPITIFDTGASQQGAILDNVNL